MLLDDDAVEKYIVKIATGSSIEIIGDSVVVFRYPTNIEKLKAESVYSKEYQKALDDGLLNREALEKLIKERNLFSEQDQEQLNRLKSKLDAQRVLLSKTTVVKANQNRIKGIIEGLKKEINELSYKRTSRLMMSAESKASEEKILYLCWLCSFNEDEERLWGSYSNFKNTTQVSRRDDVIGKFISFYSGIKTEIVRFIARHSLWRIRYVNSQKTGEKLFGVSTVNYTTDMLNLAYWSNYYDNIYQMTPEDRPSDLVIEDDEALDAYMKSYYEDRSREDAARKSKNRNSGKLSAFDSEEVIVTHSNELWQDIEYTKPKEAQAVKNRTDLKKRTKRG